MDSAVMDALEVWLNDPAIADEDKKEIHELRAANQQAELTDRFYRALEFGTGGLRGIIGAGLNRMNIYTVGAAAQGLANYIAQQGEAAKKAGVVVAYDCRRKSDVFARRTACVMAGNGITAYLFDRLRPTPELSFAVRHLGCTAGVVVTASHNPSEYNGFKAYWSDGVQVVPPHDENIIEEVRRVGGFGNVHVMNADEAQSKGLLKIIGAEVDECFLQEVQATCLNPDVCRQQGKTLKIVYTGLHGTGSVLIPEALRRRGFTNIIEVAEQAQPDGDFPTVKSPNPEEGAALTMGIELAKREGADLVIGTDPDADRVGIAVRGPNNDFVLLTGNQTAALLTYYICDQLTQNGNFPDNGVLVTTVVSGDLMKEIARSYGAEVIETLTGFKWIGEKVSEFEAQGTPGKPSKAYLFGAEESYGYMPGTFTRDKDAVTSTAFIAESAAVAASQGKGLYDLLSDHFSRFGYYQEGAKNVTLKGKEGADKINAIMDELRSQPPVTIDGIGVTHIVDFMTHEKKDVATGKVVEKYDLPASNVVMFVLQDDTKVIARPSGTEPKIKFYILAREHNNDLASARAAATQKIDGVVDDLLKCAGLC